MQDPTKVVGRRVVAFIVDSIILSAVSAAIFFAMATKSDSDTYEALTEDELRLPADADPETIRELSGENTYGNLELGDDRYSIVGGDFLIYLAITLGIGILYRWVLPGLTGWTPGKLLLGIRIVGEDGKFAGVLRNAVREILLIVDDFPYFIPMLTGFIVAMVSERHQRVGDLVAKTFVVRKDALGQPVVAAATAASVAASPPGGAVPPPPAGGTPPAPPPPPPPG